MTVIQASKENSARKAGNHSFLVSLQSAAILLPSFMFARATPGYAQLVVMLGTLLALINIVRIPMERRSDIVNCWLPLPALAFFWIQSNAIWQSEVEIDSIGVTGIWGLFLTGLFSGLWSCLDRTKFRSRSRAVVASWVVQALILTLGIARVLVLGLDIPE